MAIKAQCVVSILYLGCWIMAVKIPYRFKDFSVCSLPSSSNQASKCAWTDDGVG